MIYFDANSCKEIRKEWRIYDLHHAEIAAIAEIGPTWVEVKWPSKAYNERISFISLCTAGRYLAL